jgi:hypothetical protein
MQASQESRVLGIGVGTLIVVPLIAMLVILLR